MLHLEMLRILCWMRSMLSAGLAALPALRSGRHAQSAASALATIPAYATQHADLWQFSDQRMRHTASQLLAALHCTCATFTAPGLWRKLSVSPDMQNKLLPTAQRGRAMRQEMLWTQWS